MVIWIRSHIHPVLLFLGAIAMALKPVAMGTTSYGLVGWLTVAALIIGAYVTYVVPNTEGGVARYSKSITTIALAVISAAINVAPNGFSRQDIWSIGDAVVIVAIPLLFPSTTAKAVLSSGPGHMGDHLAA